MTLTLLQRKCILVPFGGAVPWAGWGSGGRHLPTLCASSHRVTFHMKLAMLSLDLGPPYLQNLSPAKMYVFLFLLQLKAASTCWTSGGNPRLVSGLGYPLSRVLAE